MIRSQILMRKLIPSSRFAFALFGSTLACAAPFLACLGVAPAQAASVLTFVSGKGIDSGDCASPAHPCHRFDFAIGQTSAGGEVKALDPASYGGVTITKSISITGVDGAGIDRGGGPVAITINAGPNDKINLSHLTLEGLGIATTGILLNSGGSLTISHCTVRNFLGAGISLQPTGAAKFLIGDTLVSDNGDGISVFPIGAGSAQGTLDHVSMNKNSRFGIHVDGRATSGAPIDVTSVDSRAINNRFGYFVSGKGVLRLAHSAATGNGTGVTVVGTVFSFGDNDIGGNDTDVSGPLTPAARQ